MSDDNMKLTATVSRLFSIMAEGDQTEEDKHRTADQRYRFYLTQPGAIPVAYWDTLSVEEKNRRLDAVDKLFLGDGTCNEPE